MISVTAFHLSFTSSWRMLLITLVVMALFIRLGFWQLDRGQEKRQIMQAYQTELQRPPLPFPGRQPRPYQQIVTQGHYLPMTLLLDNQHHDHLFGYDVLSLLQLANGQVVLVDRGWVPGDKQRLLLPTIQIPKGERVVQGQAYFPSAKRWLLGPGLEPKTDALVVIETVDPAMLRQFLHKSLYPFMIRQSGANPDGYVRDWPMVATAPERHDGYALQWFMFALVLGIIFVSLNLKKIK